MKLAFDLVAVICRLAMEVLVAVSVTQWRHPFHPEMTGKGADLTHGLFEAVFDLEAQAIETNVPVDAKKRLFLWPDTEGLTLEQTIACLEKQFPDYPHDFIECSLIGWIERGYAPENYSGEQMDELEKLTERWVKNYERQVLSRKK